MRKAWPLVLLILVPTVVLAQNRRKQRRKPVPPPTLETLKEELAALADSGYPQRVSAVRRFGLVKSRPCVEFLEELYGKETDERVRLEALRTIGQVGVDPAAEVLGKVLTTGTVNHRPIALSGLGLIRPRVDPKPFLTALASGAPALHSQALVALGGYGTPEVAEVLTRVLMDPATKANLRTTATRSLGTVLRHDAVRPWLRDTGLAPGGPFAAAHADLLHLAGPLPKPSRELREAIYPHLESRAPSVRAAAADALGEILAGKGSFAEHTLGLLCPLLEDKDPGVVSSAGVAIGRIVPVGETLETVLDHCKARSPALRALALTALEGSRDPRIAKLAGKALSDKSNSVRAAAIATLAAQGTNEAIGALVGGLKKNKSGRLNHEILTALRKLTHANPGPGYKDWKRWWKMVEDDFQPPKTGSVAAGVRKRGETATRGVPTYYGSEVVSRRVAFIVDVSGSMSANVQNDGKAMSRIALCKKELKGVIGALPKKAYFNVYWFNGKFDSWQKNLTPAGGKQKGSALEAVDDLKAGGGTNIFDPLEAALLDPDVDTIYLLSDGAPSSGRVVDPAAILREVRKLNAVRQVAIHTISIGSRSKFMKDLAKEHSGQAIQR